MTPAAPPAASASSASGRRNSSRERATPRGDGEPFPVANWLHIEDDRITRVRVAVNLTVHFCSGGVALVRVRCGPYEPFGMGLVRCCAGQLGEEIRVGEHLLEHVATAVTGGSQLRWKLGSVGRTSASCERIRIASCDRVQQVGGHVGPFQGEEVAGVLELSELGVWQLLPVGLPV
jgi:hypothetical protein